MKVESALIKELFASIKYFTEAINECINVGNEDFKECVKDFATQIDKAIDSFDLMNMQKLTKVNEDKRYDYIKHYELYANESLEKTDHVKMYKAKLYLHIKKTIRDEVKAGDLAAVHIDELYNWIEGNTIFNDSPFMKSAVSNEYFMPTIKVVQNVVDEIIEQRLKAPQQKLFL